MQLLPFPCSWRESCCEFDLCCGFDRVVSIPCARWAPWLCVMILLRMIILCISRAARWYCCALIALCCLSPFVFVNPVVNLICVVDLIVWCIFLVRAERRGYVMILLWMIILYIKRAARWYAVRWFRCVVCHRLFCILIAGVVWELVRIVSASVMHRVVYWLCAMLDRVIWFNRFVYKLVVVYWSCRAVHWATHISITYSTSWIQHPPHSSETTVI